MPELEKPLRRIVESALVEDGARRDVTTNRLLRNFKSEKAFAQIIAKEKFVLCGLPLAEYAFNLLDENSRYKRFLQDGETTEQGKPILAIESYVGAILSAERVALNLLQLASGIATKTSEFVKAVEGTGAQIYDTRKTLPSLRPLQRYAVRIGGGKNHRYNLAFAVLIKDNHLQILRKRFKDIDELFQEAYRIMGGLAKDSEIEVETLTEMESAIRAGFRLILLDNFSIVGLKEAVSLARKIECMLGEKIVLEASGGINLQTVRAVAETGVDRISVGELTRNITTPDVSLDILT